MNSNQNMFLYIFILIIIIILFVCIYYFIILIINNFTELPKIHIINDNDTFNVVILAGTHGNEPAPSYYLNWLIHNKYLFKNFIKIRYNIIPFVNLVGIKNNK